MKKYLLPFLVLATTITSAWSIDLPPFGNVEKASDRYERYRKSDTLVKVGKSETNKECELLIRKNNYRGEKLDLQIEVLIDGRLQDNMEAQASSTLLAEGKDGEVYLDLGRENFKKQYMRNTLKGNELLIETALAHAAINNKFHGKVLLTFDNEHKNLQKIDVHGELFSFPFGSEVRAFSCTFSN